MARMPDIEADTRAALGWAERHLRQHPPPAPVPSAQQAQPTQPEEPAMSTWTELHRIEQVMMTLGEDAVSILEAVAGNPEAKALVLTAARLAGLPLTPGVLTAAAAGLGAVENTWHTAQQALHAQQQGTGSQPAQNL